MGKKDSKVVPVSKGLEEMDRARMATVISSSDRAVGPVGVSVVPDPEVPEKAVRRIFTADHKRRILREADACKKSGQLGALLRREGLYSSNLTTWRRQVEQGTVDALSPSKLPPTLSVALKSGKTSDNVLRLA